MHHFRHTHKAESSNRSIVRIGNAEVGGGDFTLIAGPCSVESYEILNQVGETCQRLSVPCIRGGAFKARTSPYSFQGLGEEGLQILGRVRRERGLGIVTEVMTAEHIRLAEPYADCLQVGSRNMQNFELLKELGAQRKPVLLKRGLSATIEEFLLAAEYIMAGGNDQVILCERGIRSFDSSTRNVLDLAGVALLKELTHLPVIVDPSHATGRRSLILATSRAAAAVGADGLILEAHPEPASSISDADQAISLEQLEELVPSVRSIAAMVREEQPMELAA